MTRPDDEPSAEALEALPEGRELLQSNLGKALLRFESALETAWRTDQRESATTASMKRDWGRADEARANLKREIRLALDRFRAAGVREWRPIETAPKDGKFLAWNGSQIFFGEYLNGKHFTSQGVAGFGEHARRSARRPRRRGRWGGEMTGAFDSLIARLSAAPGPDPHLDAEIEAALRGGEPAYRSASRHQFGPSVVLNHGEGNPWDGWESAPSFTGSLDAALTLVPERHRWLLDKRPGAYFRSDGYRAEVYRESHNYRSDRSDVPMHWGPTPALALCVAALKARAALAAAADAMGAAGTKKAGAE